VPWAAAISLSCRKNATITDARIPGGSATGKVTAYRLKAEDGKMKGNVTIGCAVGKDTSVSGDLGVNVYIDDYIDDFYDTSGTFALLPTSDIAYAPPAAGLVDDGLTFPLSAEQVVISEGLVGATLTEQEAALDVAFSYARQSATDQQVQNGTVQSSINADVAAMLASQFSVANELRQNPRWYQLQLKPVDAGPYAAAYSIDTTVLSLPKMIDLAAASV
jgi:hypothetical protein